jgi:hypothetical protein
VLNGTAGGKKGHGEGLTEGNEKLVRLIIGNARVYSSSNPMRSMVSRESTAVTPHPLKLGAREVTTLTRTTSCVEGDSLVDAPVGHGQELVVREGILLVAMIGMPERLLDLYCAFDPDVRCLCERNVA